MPLKWKIFLGLNFLLSLPAFICFAVLFINILNRLTRDADLLIFISVLFSLLVIPVNGFLNIYVLQRFFPDKSLPRGVKTMNTICIILSVLVAIAWLIFTIYGATQEFGSRDYETDSAAGKITVIVLFFFWILQVIVLIMQGQLVRTIGRNNRESMHSLIDSIGQQ